MIVLNQYKNKVVKYDLINKFNYKKLTHIPELKYIILNFNLKKIDTKLLITVLGSLKLITLQNPKVTTSKVSNVVFKIRKGQPIGCLVTLRHIRMNKFLFILLNKLLPNFKPISLNSNNTFSITLNNSLIFDELEQNYQFFKNLPALNAHIKFTKCSLLELKYLIKSYKLHV